MKNFATLREPTAANANAATTPKIPFYLPLYVRPDEAARLIGISRRCLSNWQRNHVLPFRRVNRTVLFAVADITAALDKFKINAIGE